MYIPKLFAQHNETEIVQFIEHNNFGILINQVDQRLWATHIPFIYSKSQEGKHQLTGHISKANKQWESFENEDEVLVIFSGPHEYISSSWYDHENVPTWNYTAVHVYGKICLLNEDELYQELAKLMEKQEAAVQNPKVLAQMPQELVRKEMKGIVGFRIDITEFQAVEKLSQNRDAKNHQTIITELEQSNDTSSHAIAGLMKKNKE